MSAQLDAAARERGVPPARFVRQLIARAVAGTPVESLGPPSEGELLELLAEKARQGNVAAIRSLLLREERQDPRSRAIALFQGVVEDRRQ